MAVNKVVLGEDTLIDLTADTVSADKLSKGITAHNMAGEPIVGTMEAGGGSIDTTYYIDKEINYSNNNGFSFVSGTSTLTQDQLDHIDTEPENVVFRVKIGSTTYGRNQTVYFQYSGLSYSKQYICRDVEVFSWYTTGVYEYTYLVIGIPPNATTSSSITISGSLDGLIPALGAAKNFDFNGQRPKIVRYLTTEEALTSFASTDSAVATYGAIKNKLVSPNPENPTQTLSSIKIGDVDYSIGGGGEPDAYIKSASVTDNTLTLVNKDDTTVEFTPQGGGTVIASNIPAPPSADGEYNLHCSIVNGVPTYTWKAE